MKRRQIIIALGLLLSTPALADEDCNIRSFGRRSRSSDQRVQKGVNLRSWGR